MDGNFIYNWKTKILKLVLKAKRMLRQFVAMVSSDSRPFMTISAATEYRSLLVQVTDEALNSPENQFLLFFKHFLLKINWAEVENHCEYVGYDA